MIYMYMYTFCLCRSYFGISFCISCYAFGIILWTSSLICDEHNNKLCSFFSIFGGALLKSTVGWSKTMIEIREVPGNRFKSCLGAVFPAVLLPTVNWELVARRKGYMDAAKAMVKNKVDSQVMSL